MQNQIALITGASSGIGEATAKALAAKGYKLIITARRIDKLNDLAQHIENTYHVKVQCLAFDISDRDAMHEALSYLPDDWRDIDVLVNNAGLALGLSPLQEGNEEDWDVVIDTNLKGLLYITRALLPNMIKRGRGHIINLGSVAGHSAYPNGNVYCATKFAVRGLTDCLRIDVIDTPIRVTSVDPGMVETNFSNVRFKGDEERAKQVYANFEPLKPEDIADAIAYCATRPDHVTIGEMVLLPTCQASANYIHKQ